MRQERIEWGRAPDLAGVDCLVVDDCANRWIVYHETYTLCTGLRIGRPAGWRYRGRVHEQTADGLMLLEPGELHANTETTAPASFRVLLIQPAVVQRAAAELGMAGVPHLDVAQLHGGPLHGELVRLHRALEGASDALERQEQFVRCLHAMLEECTERPPPSTRLRGAWQPAVQRARDFLREHAFEAVSLDDLAAAAGGSISRFHLVRSFSLQCGLPPHAFQIQLRLTRARELLAGGGRPADIAAHLGFADQSHFARHFKRTLGVSPAAYAASMGTR